MTTPHSRDHGVFSYNSAQAKFSCSETHVRLLELHAGGTTAPDFSAPLYSSIHVVPIDSTPAFKALSYCWGKDDLTHSIYINGAQLAITESLESALRHLRHNKDSVLMWVDQICINQRDKDEKSHQVRLMDRIYEKAENVIVWLGPASPTSEKAMQFYREIGQAAIDIGFRNYMGPTNFAILEVILDERDPNDVQWQRISALFAKTKEELRSSTQALFELDQREWFRRVWIVQEFCLATSPSFVCGDSVVEADLIKYARLVLGFCLDSEFLRSLSNDQRLLLARLSSNDPTPALFSARDYRQRFRRGQVAGSNLLQVLKSVYMERDARAKLRVDRIFALLSLAADAERLGITIDYNKPTEEVLCSTALSIIQNGELSILSCVQFPRDADAVNLPSWVPDWHSNLQPSFYPYPRPGEEHLFESGNRTPDILSDSHQSLLGLAGFMVDTIEDVGSVWKPSSPGPSYNPVYTESCLSEVRLLCRISSMKNTPIYDSSARRDAAAWRIPIGDIYTANQAGGEHRAGPAAALAYIDLLKTNAYFERIRIEPRNNDFDTAEKTASYYRLSMAKMAGKRPFITKSGYVGMAPSTAQQDDVVVSFLGLPTCSILQTRGMQHGKPVFFHLGEAYCDGVMDCELESKATKTSFYLI